MFHLTTASAATMTHDLATLVQLACLLEVSAPKPGNVSPGRHFADTRFEDFLASALVIGPPLACTTSPMGACIRAAVAATAAWTRRNTNLGMILLLAPLARAAAQGGDMRAATRDVLAETTVEDASEVYAAIRLAAPGGLGRADDQDISTEPTRTLMQVMTLAAERDAIAREYATGFAATFDIGAPALRAARRDGLAWDDATVETYLTLLASAHDTHIMRRARREAAATATILAAEAMAAGGVRSSAGRERIAQMDAALRRPDNALNPGSTADLTAAALFVVLAQGGWRASEGSHQW